MKNLRWLIPTVALAALIGNGCIIASGQVLAHFDLTNPIIVGPASQPFWREVVDLNTISDYSKNKDKLKGLSDVAVVGKFTNKSGGAGGLEIWITAGNTNLTTVPGIHSSATLLWGPAGLDPAVSTKNVNWNDSAKLFNAAGKQILIDSMKGAGVFTAYIFPSGAGNNDIQIDHGAIILVIAAGA